jgi:hypothetical protein
MITGVIGVFFVVTGCNRSNVVPTVPLSVQILGKWTMQNAITSTLIYGTTTGDTTGFTTDDYFDFKADSTVSILQGNVSHDGKWKISGTTLTFTGTGYVDQIPGYDVSSLTSHALSLYYTETDTMQNGNAVLKAWLNFNR